VTAWNGRPDIASLALHGSDTPSPRTLRRVLTRLSHAGYREVVTNALAPGASLPLVDAGFAVRGRLHLLSYDFGEPGLADIPRGSRRTRRANRTDRPEILQVDAAAFDDFWRFDAAALREATHATPRAHMRVAPAIDPATERTIDGYGLFGRSGSAGYVQRLAVSPRAAGDGVGRSLLCDGLRWLRSHGAQRVYVNTQDDNARALDLYLRNGFTQLPVGLCVLGREL
jgi:ribosomal protein S18 acetylase RimI-like enzyme